MSTKNNLPIRGGSTANQDDSSLLNYISYLKRYQFVLESYLEKGSEERYAANHDRCILSPMMICSRIKLENEIRNISNTIASYEKFRKSAESDGIATDTKTIKRSSGSASNSLSKVRKPNRKR